MAHWHRLVLLALVAACVLGCGKGAGPAEIPTAKGAAVQKTDVEGMNLGLPAKK